MSDEKYPTIAKMIEIYLKEKGFDGLWNGETECACRLDDLMPCSEPDVYHCKAGYEIKPIQKVLEDFGFSIGERMEELV